jgi:hypothetical protein
MVVRTAAADVNALPAAQILPLERATAVEQTAEFLRQELTRMFTTGVSDCMAARMPRATTQTFARQAVADRRATATAAVHPLQMSAGRDCLCVRT